MLDVRALVDAEEAERLLVLDSVAVDQSFDLRRGDCRELALIGIERAKAGSIGAARELAEGVDQRLRLWVEHLRAHVRLTLTQAAGEHQPQARMVLLAGVKPLFLGEILREHT